jgi:hypothetical protein
MKYPISLLQYPGHCAIIFFGGMNGREQRFFRVVKNGQIMRSSSEQGLTIEQ